MPRPKLVPELHCSDLARSLDYYTRVLGFKVLYDRAEERFAFLEREDAELMLQEPTDSNRTFLAALPEHPYGRGVHLQIEVSDIAGLHDSVGQAGATVWLPMEERWYRREDMLLGNRQFIVQDPDGYLLRFFQDLGSKPVGGDK